LAAELRQSLNVDSKLIASHGGVFEISVDGDLVFSKRKLGRFPEDGEILRLVQARRG